MATYNYKLKKTTNPLYRTWHNINMRCRNNNVPCYKNYGGRGITVCESWRNFENFYKDMFDGYKPGLFIDRIDNEEGYSPENCRWVTIKESNRNTRRTRYIEWNGQKRAVTEWAELLGVKSSTFRQRYYVYKWPLKRLMEV